MQRGDIRVLVVDDEAAIRAALRVALLELGFRVAEVERGEMALDWLRSKVTATSDAINVTASGTASPRTIRLPMGTVPSRTTRR